MNIYLFLRVRWESMHALALVAPCAPEIIAPLLPTLAELIRLDESVIVRDYAVDALGIYAGLSQAAAEQAYPLLREALEVWQGKQAHHALEGLSNVARRAPGLRDDLLEIAGEYARHERGVARKAAKELAKVIAGNTIE